jgi:hypothetical protein
VRLIITKANKGNKLKMCGKRQLVTLLYAFRLKLLLVIKITLVELIDDMK